MRRLTCMTISVCCASHTGSPTAHTTLAPQCAAMVYGTQPMPDARNICQRSRNAMCRQLCLSVPACNSTSGCVSGVRLQYDLQWLPPHRRQSCCMLTAARCIMLRHAACCQWSAAITTGWSLLHLISWTVRPCNVCGRHCSCCYPLSFGCLCQGQVHLPSHPTFISGLEKVG